MAVLWRQAQRPGHEQVSTDPGQAVVSVEWDLSYLNRDVDALIASAKIDFANSPFNPVSQQRLKPFVAALGAADGGLVAASAETWSRTSFN
jgi:hypothetical protein